MKIKGLVPAVFSPMKPNGEINPKIIKDLVSFFKGQKINALYVSGTTGEGPSLTIEERMIIAEAYVEASKNDFKVIVQVGHDSIEEAKRLAIHAKQIGADAISAIPHTYFPLNNVEILVECMKEISDASENLPFYYYHLPQLSGVDLDMMDFINQAEDKIPNFNGIKFSKLCVHEFQNCLSYNDKKYDIMFGCDQELLSGLTVGAKGAIGSTFNFAAPLYNKIIENFENGNIGLAQDYQLKSIEMIYLLIKYGGQPAFKGTMKLIGIDCGPNRLPLKTLSEKDLSKMEKELKKLGFFDWISE